MEADIEVKNLAIYIHIPFCKQKCKYCDFNSFFMNDEIKIKSYVEAVAKQIRYYSELSSDFIVSSVYFGGGTPSFIDEKYIEEFLSLIKSEYNFSKDAEVTLEANPGTVDFEKLRNYRGFGVNRISFGVQTLNDELLKYIGRVHTSCQAEEGGYFAREAGFSNISLDVMFGLPHQSIKDVDDTIRRFIDFKPEHISAYSLKVEDNTVFGRMYRENALELPDEGAEREMYYLIKERLSKSGYIQYEISNFSRPGFESKHNTAYWERQDYLGFGVSAASCFHDVRFSNVADFDAYIKNPIENFSEREFLTEDIVDSEKIILGLRLLRGVKESLFFKDEWKEALYRLIDNGLLIKRNGFIMLTDRGLDLANRVFIEFI